MSSPDKSTKVFLKAQKAKAKTPEKSTKSEAEAGIEAAERAAFKAKVVAELAKLKQARSAYTSGTSI